MSGLCSDRETKPLFSWYETPYIAMLTDTYPELRDLKRKLSALLVRDICTERARRQKCELKEVDCKGIPQPLLHSEDKSS